jgi:AcrR family transcriptional regulator
MDPEAGAQRERKPQTRAERGEASRERILEAAIGLFAERGYDGVRLEDISERCGAKRALILYYYRSKDELWRTCADQVSSRFNATVQRKLSEIDASDERTRLRCSVEAWLDSFLEQPRFAQMLVREGGVQGPRLEWLVRHFGYSEVRLGSPAFKRRMKDTIMRDALMAIFLAFAALGPLMETSLSYVSGRPTSGVHPLSRKNRRELVDLLLRFRKAADDDS